MSKRRYQVTTSWRRAATLGVMHSVERGECTADAMRLARDDVFDRHGDVEITAQHAREKFT